MFVGYDDLTKSYWVYESKKQKILITYNIVSNESQISYYHLKLKLLVEENAFNINVFQLSREQN